MAPIGITAKIRLEILVICEIIPIPAVPTTTANNFVLTTVLKTLTNVETESLDADLIKSLIFYLPL